MTKQQEARPIGKQEAAMLAERECTRQGKIFNWVEAVNGQWQVCATNMRSFRPMTFRLKGVVVDDDA